MPDLQISVKCGKQTHQVQIGTDRRLPCTCRSCQRHLRPGSLTLCAASGAQVELPPDAAVAELQAALVEPSGVMARKQKLIFKGKARAAASMSRKQ